MLHSAAPAWTEHTNSCSLIFFLQRELAKLKEILKYVSKKIHHLYFLEEIPGLQGGEVSYYISKDRWEKKKQKTILDAQGRSAPCSQPCRLFPWPQVEEERLPPPTNLLCCSITDASLVLPHHQPFPAAPHPSCECLGQTFDFLRNRSLCSQSCCF